MIEYPPEMPSRDNHRGGFLDEPEPDAETLAEIEESLREKGIACRHALWMGTGGAANGECSCGVAYFEHQQAEADERFRR